MGNPDNVFKVHEAQATQLPDGLAIVASKPYIDLLAADLQSSALISAILLPRSAVEPVSGDLLPSLKVIALEVDPSQPASLERLESIRSSRPNLPIVAAIGEASQADLNVVHKLVRLGVRDVVRLPFSVQELTSRLIDVLINANETEQHSQRGALTVFQRSVGGAGATTVITHAARLLAEQEPSAKICLVDLDIQTGSVAQYLGIEPPVDLGGLLDAGQRMDSDLVGATLLESEHGFRVLAAPLAIRPLESVEVNHILRLFDILRARFDYVLVDLPSAWSNWSLSLASTSDRVMLVCGTTIASLRQAKRKIELLADVGVDRQRIGIVANKLERRLFKSIGAAEVEAALGCEVLASLGFEGNELTAGQDIGRLLHDLNRRSKFLSELSRLVVQIPAMAGAR